MLMDRPSGWATVMAMATEPVKEQKLSIPRTRLSSAQTQIRAQDVTKT